MEESYYHHDECVGAEVAVWSADYIDLLAPVLQEGCEDVEPLIDLAIRVNEVGVIHRENVVDADIHI